jgi:hypothetical protein
MMGDSHPYFFGSCLYHHFYVPNNFEICKYAFRQNRQQHIPYLEGWKKEESWRGTGSTKEEALGGLYRPSNRIFAFSSAMYKIQKRIGGF